MKAILFFGLFVLGTILAAEIIELNDTNFNTEISNTEWAVVNFHATWCHACKWFKPQYDLVATELVKLNANLKMFAINSDVGRDTMKTFKINSYPTIKLFKNGQFYKNLPYGYSKTVIDAAMPEIQ